MVVGETHHFRKHPYVCWVIFRGAQLPWSWSRPKFSQIGHEETSVLFCKESCLKKEPPMEGKPNKRTTNISFWTSQIPQKHDDYMIATSQWNAKSMLNTRISYDVLHMIAITSRSPDRFPHVAAVQIMWSGLKVRKKRRTTPGCFVCYRLFQNNVHGFRIENGEKKKHMVEDIHKSQSEAVDFSIQLKSWRRKSFRHSWKHTSPEFWDADFNTTIEWLNTTTNQPMKRNAKESKRSSMVIVSCLRQRKQKITSPQDGPSPVTNEVLPNPSLHIGVYPTPIYLSQGPSDWMAIFPCQPPNKLAAAKMIWVEVWWVWPALFAAKIVWVVVWWFWPSCIAGKTVWGVVILCLETFFGWCQQEASCKEFEYILEAKIPDAHRHVMSKLTAIEKTWQLVASWWFQPIWKILVKVDHFPKVRGEHKRYLKPPSRWSRSNLVIFMPAVPLRELLQLWKVVCISDDIRLMKCKNVLPMSMLSDFFQVPFLMR